MKLITSLIALLLLTLSATADSDSLTPKLHGGIARRSSPLDSIPKLFVRQSTCPPEAPNVCDVRWCAQVCCGDGDGSYCLYGETCKNNGCCKVGKTCVGFSTGVRDSDDVRAAANSGGSRGTGIAAALFVGAAVAAL
ncbi:hypothetical protein L873DRAFT_1821928 [Choiromyces venosus 120613-1]|uniref:Uncharacterized protein n=1 Tax=Choiromyces venosus 120613-1 TaxID=1336337 RepID=A0A3N4J083_9PEZI|nr:hypothetical protein L873DRAFT_1821928 [Choiromyces venosus 120613-1]